jgi:hypothetical protein
MKNTKILAKNLVLLPNTKSVEIVAYCIGNFTTQKSSRYQLLSLFEIIKSLKKYKVTCSFYDPVFTDDEIRYLQSKGHTYLDGNKKVQYSPTKTIIYYMPYCDILLYDLVLKQNWNLKALGRIIIIGNGLHLYAKTRFKSKYVPRVYENMNLKTVLVDDYNGNTLQKVFFYITTFNTGIKLSAYKSD